MTEFGLERYGVDYEAVPQEQPFLTDADGDSLDNDIVLTVEPMELKLTVNMAQYSNLLSAALNGALRFWGDEYIDVIYPLIKAGKEFAMTCEDVADCIETNEVTQQALADVLLGDTIVSQALTQAITETLVQMGFDPNATVANPSALSDEIKDLEGCNLDRLWGGIRWGIVERLDDNARQFLEIMVAKIDVIERANAVIGAVPVVGTLASAVIDQFVEVLPDLLNAFESYSSIDARDEAACGIFSIVCSECRYPTTQELYDYFSSFGDAGIADIATLTANIAYSVLSGLATGSGLVVWHTMIAVQLFTLLVNEKFANLVGIASIETIASFGEEFAADDWKILCGDCVEPRMLIEYDFTQSQHGSYVLDGLSQYGQYIAGEGWMFSPVGGGQRLAIAIPVQLNGVVIRAVGALTQGLTITGRSSQLRTQFGVTVGSLNLNNGTGDYNHCRDTLNNNAIVEQSWQFQTAANTQPTYLRKAALIIDSDGNRGIPTSDSSLCT